MIVKHASLYDCYSKSLLRILLVQHTQQQISANRPQHGLECVALKRRSGKYKPHYLNDVRN